MSERRAAIYGRFTEAVAGVALPVSLAPEVWANEPTDRLHWPFGISVPREDPNNRLVFHYCADLIMTQTTGLSGSEFDAYLDALEMHVTMHIVHIEEPLEEVERTIDKVLADVAPTALSVQNRVQIRVLDG